MTTGRIRPVAFFYPYHKSLHRNLKILKHDDFAFGDFGAFAEMFEDKIEKDAGGFIVTNDKMETSIEGVFAAGDLRTTPLRQVITAASDGAVAATYAIKYIEALK